MSTWVTHQWTDQGRHGATRHRTDEECLGCRRTPMEREALTLLPQVGSWWVWEPLCPGAHEDVQVTAVKWNGEEWWIESENLQGKRAWNCASRWVEATVFLHVEDGEDE